MIDVKQLSFTYTRSVKPAVRDLNFHIEPGEIFGFLGPSGAGKSTTQKILIGLLKDHSGAVSVFGRDLRQWSSDYYERIGVSFEVPNHYLKLTAVENLTYYRSLYSGSTEEPEALLAMVGLAGDGNMRVSQFSKGMKNRLSVARSLIHNPELIFFDEPTTGLDPVNARRVKEIIRRQKAAGKTIFLTTHDMNVADELCDRVAFIVDGAIDLIDSPRELKLRYGRQQLRVEYGRNDQVAETEFPLLGLAENNEFLDLLRQNCIQTMHTQEATLESIFIDVTGRSLI